MASLESLKIFFQNEKENDKVQKKLESEERKEEIKEVIVNTVGEVRKDVKKISEKHECIEEKLTKANNDNKEKYDFLMRKLNEMQLRFRKVEGWEENQ